MSLNLSQFEWGRKCEFLCEPFWQVRSYKKQTLNNFRARASPNSIFPTGQAEPGLQLYKSTSGRARDFVEKNVDQNCVSVVCAHVFFSINARQYSQLRVSKETQLAQLDPSLFAILCPISNLILLQFYTQSCFPIH